MIMIDWRLRSKNDGKRAQRRNDGRFGPSWVRENLAPETWKFWSQSMDRIVSSNIEDEAEQSSMNSSARLVEESFGG